LKYLELDVWILKWLPDFVFYLILLAGLAGLAASFVLKFVPFVSLYRTPIQWVAGVLTAFGLYMTGAISDNNAWLARVAELEKQVAVAEAKSQAENVKIVTRVMTKREYYRTRDNDIIQYVDREVAKYDNSCPVPQEVVKALNDAAGGKR
jgi:hypothetical protein